MSARTGSSLGSTDVDPRPGTPDPSDEGDARPEPAEPASTDWVMEDEGPFFAWLPPEDRLWRHPSEEASSGPVLEPAGDRSSGRRWSAILPSRAFRSTWMVALVAGLIGATAATGVGVAGGLWPHDTTVVKSSEPSTSSVSLAAIGPTTTNWTAIDDSVALSVVAISVDAASGPEVGSGMVFMQAPDGYTYVVTDRALFARGLAEDYYGAIEVTFPTGETARASMVGTDALSGLAVIKVPSPASGDAVAASMGSVSSVSNADPVLAVGSSVAPSVSAGQIAGQDRTVDLADGTDIDGLMAVSMSALSQTGTGGPLLDQFGQVIGVTLNVDPVDAADQQFTFAVPIDVVSRIATAFINGVAPSHPWLGVTNAIDVPSGMAHQMGIFGGVIAGAVTGTGPAGQAGVRPNDIITSVDGKAAYSTGALVADVSQCTAGHPVPITYLHSGRTVRTMVRVGNEPADS